MLQVTPWFTPEGKTVAENCCVWPWANCTVRGVADTLSGVNEMGNAADEFVYGANDTFPLID